MDYHDVEVQGVIGFLCGRYSTLLEEDDLKQESYFAFLKAQNSFNSERAGFKTFFRRTLESHFIDLYRKEKLKVGREVTVDFQVDVEEDEPQFEIPDSAWTPDETLIFNEMCSAIEGNLDGLALKVFRAKINCSKEMHDESRAGHMTLPDFARFFGVKKLDIAKAFQRVQRAVLIALGGRRGREIRELTDKLVTKF